MNLQEFKKRTVGLCIDYDGVYGHQCVDLIKHYSQNVLWVKLGSFGGSAKTGWYNRANTFKKWVFERFEYKAGMIPKPGDIIFIKTKTPYWHVWIVLEADIKNITILEQNMGSGDWKWLDDCVKISNYNYNSNILGWYRKTPEKTEFEKLIDKAVNLGIFNWKDINKPATRWEVALMCLAVLGILEK